MVHAALLCYRHQIRSTISHRSEKGASALGAGCAARAMSAGSRRLETAKPDVPGELFSRRMPPMVHRKSGNATSGDTCILAEQLAQLHPGNRFLRTATTNIASKVQFSDKNKNSGHTGNQVLPVATPDM